MRVLHVLANGPPDVNGYAVRTHNILATQKTIGNLKPVGITSPWYPERESMAESIVIDEITYHRCLHPSRMQTVTGMGMKWSAARGRGRVSGVRKFSEKPLWRRALHFIIKPLRPGWAWIEERILFNHFTTSILTVAKEENAEIIHAHVPYRVGIPAMRVARKLGLPFVYEMRGMWEESAVASGRWRAGGLAHRRFRRMESKVLRNADAVVCISETLRNEAISRGVSSERILVVPNAVSHDASDSEEPELLSEVKMKLGQNPVVGYIGSLRELEGVDFTASAVAELRTRGIDAKLFVLSTESGQSELIAHCEILGIADHVHIVGPVPHEQVSHFYELIDVFVVSRPDTRVTRLVTPLKPFEAMYHARPLVMSNLPALAEIIDEGRTGLLYPPGDLPVLVDSIEKILTDKELAKLLGNSAKDWIISERTWSNVCSEYIEAYALAKNNSRGE